MCGIVGILGNRETAPALVDALTRLEYRGYDSSGIAVVRDGRMEQRRAVGKLANLSDLLVREPVAGESGIGHTRWATHGSPSVANAHPHRAGRVAVVHNGIIENYRELSEELGAAGRSFASETDTEAVAHHCDMLLECGESPVSAVTKTVARLKGSYALCFLFEGEDDLIIAARTGSPLVLGHGSGEMYVGSDALALSTLTDRVTYLEDGDLAVVTRRGAEIRDGGGFGVERVTRAIPQDTTTAEKGKFKHFMLKEIFEQPAVLAESARRHSGAAGPPAGIDYSGIDRLLLSACGTAYLACHVARYWFESLAALPVDLDIASEFRYREPPLSGTSLALFVSQSGETADTLAALRYCQGRVAATAAMVNVEESSLAREADVVLPIYAGREIGVASTKAFTCQLAALVWQAIIAGRQRGELGTRAARELESAIRSLPGLVNSALDLDSYFSKIGREFSTASGALFLGRGSLYPIAMEGALKLKEISYIHAEGYASGELKHGPIALVDEHMPVIVVAPKDALFEKSVSNMQEVMARGGKTLLITDSAGARLAGDGAWKTIVLPRVHPVLAPILHAVPVQLLAYHTAAAKGTDIDQPRNLAKSVTVE